MNTSVTTAPRRILVVTLADLGDALLTTPALQELRQTHPAAYITVLTTPTGRAALERLMAIDEIIVFDKHRFNDPRALLQPANLRDALHLWRQLRGGYDSCVILHHLTTRFGTLKYAALALTSGAPRRYGLDNGRGWFLTDRVRDDGFGARHQAEYWLAVVRLLGERDDLPPPLPLFAMTHEAAARADDLRESWETGPTIAIHPGSGAFAPARRWMPPRWAALADALIEDGYNVVLIGGAEEADLRRSVLAAMTHANQVIDLGGRTSLGELAGVLRRCTLMIGNDSGLTHLAASVGTPVVGVFGPTDPRAWGPYGGDSWTVHESFPNGVEILHSGAHRALKAAIACSPCIYRGHNLGTPQGCPDRTCLQRISVDQVLLVVRQRLTELHQPCASMT
jgi:lipopolysaccharide heptosyltransferase II